MALLLAKKLAHKYVANVWAILSRYQNAAAASREYAERFPERYHPGPRQLLI
jgi:hypothetical protein